MKNTIYILLLLLLLFVFTKVSAQGWQWGRGNTGGTMDSWPVATDISGNVFVAGFNGSYFFGATPSIFDTYSVPISATINGAQCIISKYDSAGNFLWAKGPQTGFTFPINITTDQNGNSILFGVTYDAELTIGSITLANTSYPDHPQYFIIKFDPSGNILWAKSDGEAESGGTPFNGGYLISDGGIVTDAANNIYIISDFRAPTITVGGYTLTNTDPSGNTDDILLAKYDSSGNVIWATSAGGSGIDRAHSITVTSAGDIYIAGMFGSPSIKFGSYTVHNESNVLPGNAFIARYNNLGIPVWASSTGGQNTELATGIASDKSNNVYLTGAILDSISYNGTTIVNPNTNTSSLYLVKFDSSNNVKWYKTIYDPTDNNNVVGYSVATSSCGTVWVSGSFGRFADTLVFTDTVTGKLNIDGHILNTPGHSTDPVFIAGFSANGTYISSAALQSGGDDQNSIACDAFDNVYLCADYYSDPFVVNKDTLANTSLSANVEEWQYVAKYHFVNNASSDTSYTHLDTSMCPGNSIILYAPTGYSSYLWNNGSTNALLNISAAGPYWVAALGGCMLIDSINVTENPLNCCMPFLPDAFTPNNDGRNDHYNPLFYSDCTISGYSFSIFNRWGQLVFYSEDPAAKWDGTFNGIKSEMGTYMYYLKYSAGSSNATHEIKGDVTLVR